MGGPRGCSADLSASVAIRPWFLSPPLLSSAQEEALLGGLWLVLSHKRGLRAVAAQSRPSWKRVAARDLPGAPAAADPEGEAPGSSQLPPPALRTQLRCSTTPRPMPQLLLFPRHAPRKQGVQCSLFLERPRTLYWVPATPSCSSLPPGTMTFNWEAGVQAWGVA